jgi:POT family proton-dependent oligopeptide transporter
MKHPKAIPYLFLTEMWERFSYYGITAILILYMNKVFNITTDNVYAIYGAYGALVYMTPLIGGALADKWLGSVNAVVLGGVLIALGHFVVAVQDPGYHYFYLGLAIIIVGTGFFSPNINAIVGHLYQPHDPRRDNGFTLAYMGRNIGTILAPIVCAWIAAQYDWHYAFIVAGVGMLFGLQFFLKGRRHYDKRSFDSHLTSSLIGGISVFICLLTALVFFVIEHVNFVGPLLVVTVFLMMGILCYYGKRETLQNRRHILIAFILTLFYIVFMVLLQQSGGALNLFTDDFVNRSIGDWTIETGMFQSVEPLALVLLTPLYNLLWTALSKRKKRISDGFKFVLGLSLMSLSFLLMAAAMNYANAKGLISMYWINSTYLLQAAGELFIGPIGLSMVSRLIPTHMLGLYMGFWVLGSAIANFVAAKIGAYITPPVLHESILTSLLSYQLAFYKLAAFGLLSGLILFCVLPLLKLKK